MYKAQIATPDGNVSPTSLATLITVKSKIFLHFGKYLEAISVQGLFKDTNCFVSP